MYFSSITTYFFEHCNKSLYIMSINVSFSLSITGMFVTQAVPACCRIRIALPCRDWENTRVFLDASSLRCILLQCTMAVFLAGTRHPSVGILNGLDEWPIADAMCCVSQETRAIYRAVFPGWWLLQLMSCGRPGSERHWVCWKHSWARVEIDVAACPGTCVAVFLTPCEHAYHSSFNLTFCQIINEQ